jgi:hypothetical protein
MTVYADAAQFQAVFTRLFDDVRDAGGMDDLARQRMIVRFRVVEPQAELWVNGRADPPDATFEPTGLRATLTLDCTGDTLHELLLGTLPLGKAMSSGRLKVRGALLKARRLEGLFHAFQATYPALAAELLGPAEG